MTPGALPSPSTAAQEQPSVPTFLGEPGTPSQVTHLTPTALPSPAADPSAVTRVHSHTPGFSRPSPSGQQSPTEVFSLQPGASGTPTGRTTRGRGFGAPPTPEVRLVPAEQAPGTPTYSPTEFFAESSAATPQDSAIARVLKRAAQARAPSAEREGVSSPTYFEETQLPLPPTPTYSAGSSPTFVEENEPPTPTLEADDDDFG